MSAPSASWVTALCLPLLCPLSGSAQTPAPAGGVKTINDKPKTVIIQYESGRVLIVREVNGELLVTEPKELTPTLIGRHLHASSAPSPESGGHGEPSTTENDADAEPLFYSPAWYPYHQVINLEPPTDASRAGRALERSKQNAAEQRQQVEARRRAQGEAGLTNRAGRVFPSTAADQERADRIAEVQRQVNGSPYATFYGLGYGLEYFRQQELAARRELALLTYDVLLEEGLAYFRNRRYAQAARSFLAAADKDHGDAGSRLHAAQCLMASGLYGAALVQVRRAFELAPQLIYRPLNHRDTYAFPVDFDRQIAELERYVSSRPEDDHAVLLLAYEQFFSATPRRAAPAMRRVKSLSQSDGFAKRLWKAAQPVFGDL